MLGRDDVVKLVRVVAGTRETEIGCDECFERLDRLVEAELSGLDATAAMPLVGDHFDKCPDCRGTFEALRQAVRNT
jgi:hypothetical protein